MQPSPNYTGCMMQAGPQWRPVGKSCFGGSGADQVCSDQGRMSPLSSAQFGTLDDNFNGIKWIYADFGRVVVTSPKNNNGNFIPAIPYVQNGFVLLQIALQEARQYVQPPAFNVFLIKSQAAKTLACVSPCISKSAFTPTQIFPYPNPDMPWGMTSYNVCTLVIFLCGWPIFFTCASRPCAFSDTCDMRHVTCDM